MTLGTLIEKLHLTNLTPEIQDALNREVAACYMSDLLSDVLANAPRQAVLVTIQVHLNVVAVAVHAELAAVIFAMDRTPDETVCRKAAEEGIALLVSAAPAFEIAGQLYSMGLRSSV